jgi:aspartate/tyrosine/aromatic aminotransferase
VGRINVAGLNDAVMPYFVESLAAVLSKYPATPKL